MNYQYLKEYKVFLPNEDFLILLKNLLTGFGVEYTCQDSKYSPCMTFYFEGHYCWVIDTGRGYKVASENEKTLKSLQQTYHAAMAVEED